MFISYEVISSSPDDNVFGYRIFDSEFVANGTHQYGCNAWALAIVEVYETRSLSVAKNLLRAIMSFGGRTHGRSYTERYVADLKLDVRFTQHVKDMEKYLLLA